MKKANSRSDVLVNDGHALIRLSSGRLRVVKYMDATGAVGGMDAIPCPNVV